MYHRNTQNVMVPSLTCTRMSDKHMTSDTDLYFVGERVGVFFLAKGGGECAFYIIIVYSSSFDFTWQALIMLTIFETLKAEYYFSLCLTCH